MKAAARVQAAIEILEVLTNDLGPVDRIISTYFRQRRYAGSKDRRWVIDLIYDLLRQRAFHVWRGAENHSRRLLISQLETQGVGNVDIAGIFSGEKFAPAVLDEEETRFLKSLGDTSGDPPDWVLGNYPRWLASELEEAFAADLPRQMQALNRRAPVDLRVNTLRPTGQSIAEQLSTDGAVVEKGGISPLCLRLTQGRLEKQQLYLRGHVEIQDESSQIAVLLSQARPGQQVVDFCAGAGGKSLALAAMMENSGQIYSLDVDGRRLDELKRRAKRANARNIQPHVINNNDEDAWVTSHSGEMAMVFVDAPCSGLGTWRRNPDAPWRLTPDELTKYTELQNGILRRATKLVHSGGVLVYAVCSMLPLEGRKQITKFLAENSDFQYSGPMDGDPIELNGGEILLTPADHNCDGFYLARLKRA